MKAVWTHWTTAFAARPSGGWPTTAHYLLSLVLSLRTARPHHELTCLSTDTAGANLLIDQIGLEYDQVSTRLDHLAHYDGDWWNLGKLHTYRSQKEPFVHVDSDVYLWQGLVDRLTDAPVLAQNPEHFTDRSDYYSLRDFDVLAHTSGGWLPPEWQWCRFLYGDHQRSVNTGVYGGHNTQFIRYCANLAFDLLDHPGNRATLPTMPNKIKHAGLIEMFLPSACRDYHRGHPDSPYTSVDIEYLFPSSEEAYAHGARAGYTHIIGKSKLNRSICRRLEERVRCMYPVHFKRCLKYAESLEHLAPNVTDHNLRITRAW